MPITHSSNTIEAKNVSFSFGTQVVLEDINFTVKRGEYLGIVGPNGAGKTTLVKIILGLLKPTAGTISIFGEGVGDWRRHGHIGYVSQRAGQIDPMYPATVEEIVRSGRFARIGVLKFFGPKDHKAIARAMELAGIASLSKRPIGALSGGERQKVFIARAIAGDAEVLILDEPIAGVDISTQQQFFTFLRRLNEKENLTIFLVAHDIDTVIQEVSSILCVNRQLVCHTTPREFVSQNILEKLYGKKVRTLGHDHHH